MGAASVTATYTLQMTNVHIVRSLWPTEPFAAFHVSKGDNLTRCSCFFFILLKYVQHDKHLPFLQSVFYFPLREKLKALMKVRAFMLLIQHEYTRPRNPNFMTDVFDSPAWQEFMGAPSFPCEHIGVQICSDGFPVFDCGSKSLKPLVTMIFSLPPALRTRAEFMFLLMLLPSHVKNSSLKKYYDFAATYELNELYHTGSS